jgi:hypothetical protein
MGKYASWLEALRSVSEHIDDDDDDDVYYPRGRRPKEDE